MIVVCLDFEGVLVFEIWIGVAEQTGIADLRLTTRDIADYDELMRHRLRVLDAHGLRIQDIHRVIDTLQPMEGALDFLADLRVKYQVIILSDTFYQFATPLMRQLGWPTLFCHQLLVAEDGRIEGYNLRQRDQKREAVTALRGLGFDTIAAGDSYNDTSMLAEADRGILFRPPAVVVQAYPRFPVTSSYEELGAAIDLGARELDAPTAAPGSRSLPA
jgi:phosphoserine/homoserine phosphotransferase